MTEEMDFRRQKDVSGLYSPSDRRALKVIAATLGIKMEFAADDPKRPNANLNVNYPGEKELEVVRLLDFVRDERTRVGDFYIDAIRKALRGEHTAEGKIEEELNRNIF